MNQPTLGIPRGMLYHTINTLCTAGTGDFLSSQAKRQGLDIEGIELYALKSERPTAIESMDFRVRDARCGKRANNCEIICVYRGGTLIDAWGNRCDRGAIPV